MYRFGETSERRLATVDSRLQEALHLAMSTQVMDFTIVCGHRDELSQQMAFNNGTSKKTWPHSKHNEYPSKAVDVAPWPIDWRDHYSFSRLAGIIEACARIHGLQLRWGGDWDRDGGSRDQSFMDIGHLEIVE